MLLLCLLALFARVGYNERSKRAEFGGGGVEAIPGAANVTVWDLSLSGAPPAQFFPYLGSDFFSLRLFQYCRTNRIVDNALPPHSGCSGGAGAGAGDPPPSPLPPPPPPPPPAAAAAADALSSSSLPLPQPALVVQLLLLLLLLPLVLVLVIAGSSPPSSSRWLRRHST